MYNPITKIKTTLKEYSGFAFRFKLPKNHIFYMLFTRVDNMVGFDSKVGDKHILMIDTDSEDYINILSECVRIQFKYDLGKMFIVSDKPDSYRIWCFKLFTLREILNIICDFKYTDLYFIRFTAKRGKSILRVSSKKDRENQRIVKVIDGRDNPIPEKFHMVKYETPDGKVKQFYTPEEIG